ncbi:Mitochondrial sodium/calcium exchanger protein [Tyrophagus putrescentiae]|nr:Mitochondrial sodium/calcium exchanger protein [Tyrophagus putrescentiae]
MMNVSLNLTTTVVPWNHEVPHDNEVVKCITVNSLPRESQCDFLLSHDKSGGSHLLAIALWTLLLLFWFVCISTVADKFLCPNLLAISKFLHLPDNIAGVTLLAFGNGAPDIFSSISGIGQSRPELIFGSLFGSGIFDTTVVVGAILLIAKRCHFERPILRDIAFYLVASLVAFLFIKTGHFTLNFAIILLSLYALYIIVVAFSRCVYVRKAHRRSTISRFSKYDSLDNDDDEDVEAKICRNNNNDKYGTFAVEGTDEPKSQHHSCGSTPSSSPHSTNDIFTFSIQKVSELDSEDDENEEVDEVESKEKDDTKENIPTIAVPVIRRRCKVFKKQNCFFKNGTTTLQHFSAIDLQNWRKSGYLGKAYQVFAAVPNFCLNLCIPTVDEERPESGWSQLLICINIFLAPQAVYFLLDLDIAIHGHIPLWALLAFISLLTSAVVFATSAEDQAPVYQPLFAFTGFLVCITFLNAISGEIVSLLSTLGIIFDLSDSLIGMTVLAWGNCLGDLVSDVAMAKAGHSTMALSAAISGPMFNLLIGLGLPYGILFIRERTFEVPVEFSCELILQYATITVSLAASLFVFVLALSWPQFRAPGAAHLHAAFLCLLYLLYISCSVMMEFQVLFP